MKKVINLLCLIILLLMIGCTSNKIDDQISNPSTENDKNKVLIAVLNNDKTFIDEDGKAKYLFDYSINETINAVPHEYTFVDFDGDDQDELVVNVSSDFGIYLIFNFNGMDVFSHQVDARSLISLKTDGSFMISGGAGINHYCRSIFEGSDRHVWPECVKDSTSGEFLIDGENVSTEEINEFINDWNLKKDVEWITISENYIENDSNQGNVGSTAQIPQDNNEPQRSTIDLNKYISVSFSGYNLAGKAYVNFDIESYLLDATNNVGFKQENLSVYRDLYEDNGKSPAYELKKFITPKIADYQHISNGDTVEVVWIVDTERIEDYFECDLSYYTDSYTVNGLSDAKTFDPFDSLEIEFSSIAPFGKASAYNYYDNHNGKYLLSKSEGLSNGDIITITYECKDMYDMIDYYGEYPSSTEKQFVVEGLKAFPSSIDDFSSDVLSDVEYVASNYFANRSNEVVVNSYHIEGYAFIRPSVNVESTNSRFYAIYQVEATAVYNEKSQNFMYYMVFEFNNPIIENGKCSMRTSNYSIPSHETQNIAFEESNYTRYIRTAGFNSKDEIEQYLNGYIGEWTELIFETYK